MCFVVRFLLMLRLVVNITGRWLEESLSIVLIECVYGKFVRNISVCVCILYLYLYCVLHDSFPPRHDF